MKLFRFSNSLFYIGAIIFATACGSANNEKQSAADSTAAADSAAKAQAAANTIVTTPQNVVGVTHKVANYAKWLTAYDAHDSARLAAGLHNYVIGRGLRDSNIVLIALKCDDTAKAMAFGKSPGLKAAMKKGGIIGTPTMSLMTETWQDTAKIETSLRSISTFTVKDWDAFAKAFQDAKQTRTDNGVMARVVGHEANDNKKVTVVSAILDSAKAFAWYKSDAFKQHIQAAGVVGEPTRLIFNIVKSY